MDFKNIVLDLKDNVAVITINRPDVLNALDMRTVEELELAIRSMGGDNNVRAVIITGAGDKAFVSGADIATMKAMNESSASEFSACGHRCMNVIESSAKPIIAAVGGFALGGGTELVLACDIVIASDDSKFGLPEVKLGLYPGFGGTQRLPRAIGKMRASEMIFTGMIIDAARAIEWGLVNRVVDRASLMDDAMKTARIISSRGPIAVSQAKRMIIEGMGMSYEGALKNEQEHFSKLFTTSDSAEGLAAFLEKRKPNFKGE